MSTAKTGFGIRSPAGSSIKPFTLEQCIHAWSSIIANISLLAAATFGNAIEKERNYNKLSSHTHSQSAMHLIPRGCKTLTVPHLYRTHVYARWHTLVWRRRDLFSVHQRFSLSSYGDKHVKSRAELSPLNSLRASQHVTHYSLPVAPPTRLTFLLRVCMSFWVGGGELLICGTVRRREVVFQARYGGSAAERKTPLTLGNFTWPTSDRGGYRRGAHLLSLTFLFCWGGFAVAVVFSFFLCFWGGATC